MEQNMEGRLVITRLLYRNSLEERKIDEHKTERFKFVEADLVRTENMKHAIKVISEGQDFNRRSFECH